MNKKYFWPSACLSFVLGLAFSFYFIKKYLALDIFCFCCFLFLLFLNIKNFSTSNLNPKNKKKIKVEIENKITPNSNKVFIYKCLVFFLLFFSLGFWRQQVSLADKEGNIENYLNKELVVRARVISDAEIKDNRQKIKVKILSAREEVYSYNKNNSSLNNNFRLQGRVLIVTLSSPVYQRGDILEISGKYLAGGMIADFDYSLYLKRFGIGALSYYPKIKKISQSSNRISTIYFSVFSKVKNKIGESLESHLGFESSAVVWAMFLGNKTFLDDDLKTAFSRSGLSHIIAISGMHISLLSAILWQLLAGLGLSRRRSFYVCVSFLFFYLILIGAPASALRASLMGFLALLAVYMGRLANLLNALFLSAFFMLLCNPWLLLADIGFQLSFLAVLAIIFLRPHIKESLQLFFSKNKKLANFFKTKIGEAIIDIVSITVSVQIFSAPILISSFHQFSLIAPFSNLLVVFLLPVVISLILLALSTSYLLPFLGEMLYCVLDLAVSYICLVGKTASRIPYSAIEINSWNIYFTFIYYFFLIYFLYKKNRALK